jgi:hypothetical protein
LREGNKKTNREEFESQDEMTQRTTLMLLAAAKFHHDRDGIAISVESENDRAMEIKDLKAAHELKNQLRFKQHILHEEKLHKDIKFFMAKALYDCTKAIQVAVRGRQSMKRSRNDCTLLDCLRSFILSTSLKVRIEGQGQINT